MRHKDKHGREAFYAGAKHSPELQSQLDAMKTWTAKRLAAAVPAWAKPKFLPPTFKPNFAQRFPSWTYASTTCKDTRSKWDFENMDYKTTEEYVDAWNARHHYVTAAEPLRAAA